MAPCRIDNSGENTVGLMSVRFGTNDLQKACAFYDATFTALGLGDIRVPTGLSSGGTCEGAPGVREAAGGRYGAYLRDPDGHKLCVYSAA